jgi:hypothetical protein
MAPLVGEDLFGGLYEARPLGPVARLLQLVLRLGARGGRVLVVVFLLLRRRGRDDVLKVLVVRPARHGSIL